MICTCTRALRFADRASRAGIALSTRALETAGDPPYVRMDVELFERAVANLVDNALKFCPAGASVELAVRRAGDRVAVSVEDDGPGIEAADLPHLFDRFFQSRRSVAPATGEGGKGLGLAIVKRIVELHGGEVGVDSEVGRGTRVTLTLPALTG